MRLILLWKNTLTQQLDQFTKSTYKNILINFYFCEIDIYSCE